VILSPSHADYTLGITCAIIEFDYDSTEMVEDSGTCQGAIESFMETNPPLGAAFDVNKFFLAIGDGVKSKNFKVLSVCTYKLSEPFEMSGAALALA